MTPTEFLTARLDEAEVRARSMGHRTDPEGEDGYYACPALRTEPLGDLEWGPDACDCGLARRQGRALREVEAKRAILRDLDLNGGDYELAVRIFAAVYADHPDYREEWRL